VERYIYGYSMATLNDELYVFGGSSDDGYTKTAAKFTGTWTLSGELLNNRTGRILTVKF